MKRNSSELPRGISVKKNRSSESIQIAFMYKGIRCREVLRIPVTKSNLRYAANLLGEIQNSIERHTFDYANYFPNSTKLSIFSSPASKDKKVIEYLDEYIASAETRGLSPSTLVGYKKLKTSLKSLHNIPVTELSPIFLKRWVQKSNNSPKTLRNKFSFLRSALAEAVTEGIVELNPIDSIKLSNYVKKDNKVNLNNEHEDIDPFTPEEVFKIYQQCKHDELNIIQFVINTGLRSSEWSALKWENVDFDKSMVTINVAIVHDKIKRTKTNAGRREIPLNDEAVQALKRQKLLSLNNECFVFPNDTRFKEKLPNGKFNRINPDSFRKHKWSRILEQAQVKYRYPYQMRHTFATRHISQGINLWQLANWMGHSSPEMLFRHYGSYIDDYGKSHTDSNDTHMTRSFK